MLPWLHERLRLDPQSIGDAVDIVEVGGDLGNIVNIAVVEAMPPQLLDVGLIHIPGRTGQTLGKCDHSAVGRRERRLAIVGSHLVSQRWVIDLGTEVVYMGLDSIRAAVGGRHNHGDHLALGAAQARLAEHQRGV